MGEFNHYIYYCGQESLRRNEVAIMVNKRVRNAVLGCKEEIEFELYKGKGSLSTLKNQDMVLL